jgi:hypothetical protein
MASLDLRCPPRGVGTAVLARPCVCRNIALVPARSAFDARLSSAGCHLLASANVGSPGWFARQVRGACHCSSPHLTLRLQRGLCHQAVRSRDGAMRCRHGEPRLAVSAARCWHSGLGSALCLPGNRARSGSVGLRCRTLACGLPSARKRTLDGSPGWWRLSLLVARSDLRLQGGLCRRPYVLGTAR